jgi:N-carbamoylputrescine amidase
VVAVGLVQLAPVPGEGADNLARACAAAEAAFGDGADLVVLPELAIPGYVTDAGLARRLAEPRDGPTARAFQRLARAHRGTVAVGIAERGDGDRPYNSVIVVDGSGLVSAYRKLHLFDLEKHAYAPGDTGLPVVALRWGTVGVCICYDLRFVEVLRLLSLRGAQLVVAPAAWVSGFDRVSHDEHGMSPQARSVQLQANLDQVGVAAVSQAGTCGRLAFLGGSVLADGYGSLLAGPLSVTGPQTRVAELDLAAVDGAQRRSDLITPRLDRRDDVYALAYRGAQW